MKKNNCPILLLALTLASCGASSSSAVSSLVSSETSLPSSSLSSEVSSSSSSALSSSPEIEEEKADRTGYPYIQNLDALKEHAFQGKWIWEAKDIADTHVAFRKVVSLSANPQRATLYLSAESKATVFINGKLVAVDAVLKRGPTPFDSFYQEIDVSAHLGKGENILCILVHYWGKGGNASVYAGKGGVLFDLDVDGILYSSDSNVKVKRLDEYRNERVLIPAGEYPDRKRSTFLAEREIYFDARLETAFYGKDFDDSAWKEATIVSSPGYLPFGELYRSTIPAFTLEDIEECVDVDEMIGKKTTAPTKATFRLKENMQFLPYFELDSDTDGAKISFYTNTYITTNLVSLMDDYVAKKGANAYQQLYWRSGSSLILELPAGITLRKVGYRRSEYDVKTRSRFYTGDTRLTSLYDKAYNTLRICMRDTFMDCPERERSPYSGDSANQIDQCLAGMGEDGWKMIEKTYKTLNGWAKDDATFQLRWPSTTSNECPMQNLAFILTIPNYYLHTGDEQTVKEIYPILQDYLNLWELNEDGSVAYRNGTFMWTDWGSGQDEDLMENGWYYWALKSLDELGTALGINDQAAQNASTLESIRDAFYPKFKKEGGFASVNNGKYDDRGNALAVLSGLAKEEDYPLIKDVLVSVKQASPYMERHVEAALAKMGYYEECLNRMLERFGPMIEEDESTLWELWSIDPVKGGTPNHGWSGGPLIVLSEEFAGIRPTSIGYATYDIVPSFALETLSTNVYTPKGELSYSLYKEHDKTYLEIASLPGGTLRLGEKDSALLSGDAIKGNDGSYALNGGNIKIEIL